jgi:hypothetical protein
VLRMPLLVIGRPAFCHIGLQAITNKYVHDGAPALFSHAVRDVFNNRWVGRAGPTAWPPRSTDMNPLWQHKIYQIF